MGVQRRVGSLSEWGIGIGFACGGYFATAWEALRGGILKVKTYPERWLLKQPPRWKSALSLAGGPADKRELPKFLRENLSFSENIGLPVLI
jgi:hypothetical protein